MNVLSFIPRIPLMGLIGGIGGPLSRSMAARVVVIGYLGPRLITWVKDKKEPQPLPLSSQLLRRDGS